MKTGVKIDFYGAEPSEVVQQLIADHVAKLETSVWQHNCVPCRAQSAERPSPQGRSL